MRPIQKRFEKSVVPKGLTVEIDDNHLNRIIYKGITLVVFGYVHIHRNNSVWIYRKTIEIAIEEGRNAAEDAMRAMFRRAGYS